MSIDPHAHTPPIERRSSHESGEVTPPPHASAFSTRAIDPGRIECLQILDEHGNVEQGMDPGFTDEQLLDVHRAMVLSRAFDSRMLTMQRQGEMGTFAPNIGQEACMIGQVWPLTKDDWFAPSYRSFGAQIWRGWSMERLMKLWAGYHEGFVPPPDVNDYPFSIVIGAQVPPAVGTAMAMRRRKEANCVVVNFGDGAFSQGAVAESLNFAAVDNAPVIFVCENNGWAISTPLTKQTRVESLAIRGMGYGVPSIRVDGNDILAMMVATRDAADRARNGEGPTLIEAVTYRMSLHTTADDPTVYRDEALVDPWQDRCPIRRFEAWLKRRGLLDGAACDRIKADCEAQVLAARDAFRESAEAKPREIFDYLYVDTTVTLERQKAEYFKRLDRKGVE
ncbi:MAG: thiamine pyrophosphate-dependent dehydrogenase E1 component subunit alpha [Phycisphaerales bacterium]|nr:thiamine pyrophosphate-dependent dehydrogenase E1 component subunit alpha [Phycisphaerales bacterium]